MAILHDDDGEEWTKQSAREHRLNTGLPGAHVVSPFQCEICWMRNLEGRNPRKGCPRDERYVQCIRRASLDAMAAKAKTTVQAHARRISEVISNCETIG